ncbi:MAG TPA: DUF948 domain-containing protein [bacterium]|jgi:hypothetical protein|nr:DUF948 domain-containing protein [bacterium]
MPSDLFAISVSITLIVLCVVLIGLFILVIKTMEVQAASMRELRRELLPSLGEIRLISHNLAVASEGLRTGIERVSSLTNALGDIGDDLNLGHRGVKGGLKFVGGLLGPWLAKLIG